MMKRAFKICFGLALSFAFSNNVYGQQAIIEIGDGIFEYYNLKPVEGKTELSYDEIEGNPYETKTFQKGRVVLTNDEVIEGELINYNRYSDHFEIKLNNNTFILQPNEKILKIEYNDQIFYHKTFQTKTNKSVNGFLKMLVSGKCTLYKKHPVIFKGEELPTTGYETKSPASFEEGKERYFLQFDEEIPREIICFFSRKKFSNYFNQYAGKIEKFMKNESLRAMNEKDLRKIIDYFNTL